MARHRIVHTHPSAHPAVNRPIIALLTDFGYSDHFAGTMKGVIASIAPDTRVVDITHGIQRQDIRSGAFALWAAYRFFPPDTIFVPVVDPGVGGSRDVQVVWNGKYQFVAPDNGILDLIVAEERPMNAVKVDVKRSPLVLGTPSATFHGRDVFAPLAAYLSRGVSPGTLGTRVRLHRPADPFVSSTSQRRGRILYKDYFGNCITNIRNELIDRIKFLVVRNMRVSRAIRFYADAPEKTVCLIRGSNGLIEMCVKNGSTADILGLKIDQSFVMHWK